ncbi:hypothetical protein NDK47_23495 [Brevibacillus ruminantium]|uniref:Uncharacterized protein n=1 Tax=Brevibacillus ruminantium TaxID=2950604 RepID=A0ABY4WD00_9BACL|nr:hypothetical protein [Brevibacillus ruminantium]USG65053.1 hypothetical protein NDK47_23495 [Brevibacillus ruminantium]
MLYGIAIVVVAAFIGLIVFNMKAGRTRPPEVPKDNPSTDPPQLVMEENKQLATPREEAMRHAEPQPKLTGTPRFREQSDDEYRNALRDFHSKGASSHEADEKKEDPVPASKNNDEAYREGLRSLGKRD